MGIINKNNALSNITANITNNTQDHLKPNTSNAIKYGNLASYLTNFINWVFPPQPSGSDLRGKVLGVKRVGTSNISDYSNLDFITVAPLGAIVMYPLDGNNVDSGGGFVKGNITGTINYLDSYLFLDGSTIDLTISANAIYRDLKTLLGDKYGNVSGDNLLRLPNMQGRVPIGYNSNSPLSPATNPSETQQNYGKCGNTGGTPNVILTLPQIAKHNHGGGYHEHTLPGNLAGSATRRKNGDESDVPFTYNNNQRTNGPDRTVINDNGNDQPHENRMEYMVMNYIIKFQ